MLNISNFRRMMRWQDSQAGYSMVEVLIAALILAMVCLGVLEGLVFLRRSAAMTENRLTSLHLARETLELLRTKKYYDSALEAQSYQLKLPAPYSGRYEVWVNYAERTKTITVTIQWREVWGMPQEVSLTTLMSESLHI